jgi:hypothetical protein
MYLFLILDINLYNVGGIVGNYLPHGICGTLGIFSPLSLGKL